MKVHEVLYTLDNIDSVAEEIAAIIPLVSIVTFAGSLGAGKTTLIQALMRKFGIYEIVQSPTFNYLSSYTSPMGYSFYHFDLYRIKNLHYFLEAGFEEYLYQPQSCALIEWPEVILPLIKKRVCSIALDYSGEGQRHLRYMINK